MPPFRQFAQVLISLLIASFALHAQRADEYQVKALFIYNFAKFVEWPPTSFTGAHDPITVCIAGEDPFGSEFDQAVQNKTVNSRAFQIRRIGKAEDPRTCQILFVASLDKKHLHQLWLAANGLPVLTITDYADADTYGVINFVMEDSKVRFDINMQAAERAHLKISSKLLSLARSVKEPPKP